MPLLLEDAVLVGSDLSSLFVDSQVASVPVRTTRQNVPLPQDSTGLPGHATNASVLHTPTTGTILLRVLDGGLIIQLVSLSIDINPIQFVFPSAVLPSPAVFLWESTELHVLAVTVTGSLFRLVIPLREDLQLWQDNLPTIWTREYLIKNYSGRMEGLVHVQGTHCVTIGLPNGSLFRIDAEFLGNEGGDDEWQETPFHASGSFFSSLTSFLSPRATPTNDSDIISMATHPWPTDIGHVFTLSRDRTLRLWKPSLGCVAVKTINHQYEPKSPQATARSSPEKYPQPKIHSFGDRQTLLRVLSMPTATEEEKVLLVAFVPFPVNAHAGGVFHIFDTQGDDFVEITALVTSSQTSGCTLQDFMLLLPDNAPGTAPILYTLWDEDGSSLVLWRQLELPGCRTKTPLPALEEQEQEERVDDDGEGDSVEKRKETKQKEREEEEKEEAKWHRAFYTPESELTPSYLEEVLLQPGSMADHFLEAIMRPGMFSPRTLKTALDQYLSACLSLPSSSFNSSSSAALPGLPSSSMGIPFALTQTYPSVAAHIAAVVGCTVTLNTNATTGEVEYDKYRNALKRDWEGFIARCREIERAARGPLVLAAISRNTDNTLPPNDDIIIVVIERERACIIAKTEAPRKAVYYLPVIKRFIKRMVLDPVQPYPLLEHLVLLRNSLRYNAPDTYRHLESKFLETVRQETAFLFKDIMQDLVSKVGDAGLKKVRQNSYMKNLVDRLRFILGLNPSYAPEASAPDRHSLHNLLKISINVVTEFNEKVKTEEEENDAANLLQPLPLETARKATAMSSRWPLSLTASYIYTSANVRYEAALSLLMICYFAFADTEPEEQDSEWECFNEDQIAELFAIFRGAAALRLVVRQAGGRLTESVSVVENAEESLDSRGDDDVVNLMRNMNVTAENRNLGLSSPSNSLVVTLVTLQMPTEPSDVLLHRRILPGPHLPTAAHRWLDGTSLLRSSTPAEVWYAEATFCDNLRKLRYFDLARELLSWFPRTAAMTYVFARLLLDIGRADDAAYHLEQLGGVVGPVTSLNPIDSEAFGSVLPGGRVPHHSCEYYIHVASLFSARGYVEQEVRFSQLAISVAPPGSDTNSLWHAVIRGYTDLGWFEDAYTAWAATPYEKLKEESLNQLVSRMCEESAVDRLTSFNFSGFADKVEAIFAYKARNFDPRMRPNYSRILYSWYTLRGDYRNAALAMYQRARKVHDLILGNPSLLQSFGAEELEAYLISLNALSLVDDKNAWILFPETTKYHPPRKRAKIRYIPEEKLTPGKYDSEIVTLADIQYEYSLFAAQVELLTRDPSLLAAPEFLLPPSSLVMRFVQSHDFDRAIAIAQNLAVELNDLFAHLTIQCLRIAKSPDTVMQEADSVWLLTDKLSSWKGSPADRAWRYLRQCLERTDSEENFYAYTKVAFETILVYQKNSPPPWLVQSLEKHHHEYLIRTSLRFDKIDNAIEYTLSLLQKADTTLTRAPTRQASATWLPYGLIDQVLAAGLGMEPPPPRLSELRTEVANRIKKIQGYHLAGHVSR